MYDLIIHVWVILSVKKWMMNLGLVVVMRADHFNVIHPDVFVNLSIVFSFSSFHFCFVFNSCKNTLHQLTYHNNSDLYALLTFWNTALLGEKGGSDDVFQRRGPDCHSKHKDYVTDLLNFATFVGNCSAQKQIALGPVNITTCSRFLRPGRFTNRCCVQEKPTWLVAGLADCISIGPLPAGSPYSWQRPRWSELSEQRRSKPRVRGETFSPSAASRDESSWCYV